MRKFAVVLASAWLAIGIANAESMPGRGVVKAIDTPKGTVSISHEAIPALKWPAMTMDFKVRDAKTLTGVKPGQSVNFDLDKDPTSGYVISRIAGIGK